MTLQPSSSPAFTGSHAKSRKNWLEEALLSLDKLLDSLGLNSTRWQWRRRRWERSWKSFLHGIRHPERADFSLSKIIIGVNLVIFSLMVLEGVAIGRGASALMRPETYAGVQFWPLVLAEGQWWRCISYAFTHGGLIHIGFNMVVLYQIGPLVENEIGKSRFIVLYTVAALTATLAGFLWNYQRPVVGASGAIMGLIGFSAAFYHRMGDSIALQRRNFMLQWALFILIFGLIVPRVDNYGHMGGAVGGTIFGFLLPIRGQLLRSTDTIFKLLGLASLAVIIVSLGLMAWFWIGSLAGF